MKILVSCLDLRSLVSARYIKEASRTSPLFALLHKETFDRLVLLALPETASEFHLAQEAIQDAYPSMAIDYLNLPIHSTDSYQESLIKLGEAVKPINLTFEDVDLTVLISSGTEGAKMSWLLLAVSGQIEGRMVQVQMPCVASNQLEPQIRTLELPRIEGAAQRFLSQYQVLEHSPNFLEDMMDRLGICGRDSEWLDMINKAYCLAQSDASVLIQGEPGTGKELIARLMHASSPRAQATMVTLDCATLQEPLTESLLFGHVRGAFRGAYNDYKGKFQQAHGGTLFLDGISELSLPAQSKLLRLIENGFIEKFGSTDPEPVNVRILAGSSRNLAELVNTGHFREDLYQRLKLAEIRIRPLRERRGDIPAVAFYWLSRLNSISDSPCALSSGALDRLIEYEWPGNVRQLRNVIQRSVMLCQNGLIEAEDLEIPIAYSGVRLTRGLPTLGHGFELEGYISRLRQRIIEQALSESQGRQSEAARLLGITPQAVHNFVKSKRKQHAAVTGINTGSGSLL